MEKIPFNRPYLTGNELNYIAEAHLNGCLAGDGEFTKKCHHWIEQRTGCKKALLTHSCTGALEMAAILLNIKPGDEVIMPSFTFVSTANAFVLRGATPVFVDVREDTLNLNEKLIEAAITPRTRAIVPVHYAGVGCEMDVILEIASHFNLKVIEDAAQGVMAFYKGRALGAIAHLGAYSFHETKNVNSGQGGCLVINTEEEMSLAEIIREKGTDRSRFFRGEVDKYTWQSIGSSFLPGELVSAFLWAQLEKANEITTSRLQSWQYYHDRLEPLEAAGAIRRPIIPKNCQHNAHMYYIVLPDNIERQFILDIFKKNQISAIFHYVPLHSSPAGMRYGKVYEKLPVTDFAANKIIRLPLWMGITIEHQNKVVEVLSEALSVQMKVT